MPIKGGEATRTPKGEEGRPQYKESHKLVEVLVPIKGEYEKDENGEIKKDANGQQIERKIKLVFKQGVTVDSNLNKATKLWDFGVVEKFPSETKDAPDPTKVGTPAGGKVTTSEADRNAKKEEPKPNAGEGEDKGDSGTDNPDAKDTQDGDGTGEDQGSSEETKGDSGSDDGNSGSEDAGSEEGDGSSGDDEAGAGNNETPSDGAGGDSEGSEEDPDKKE